MDVKIENPDLFASWIYGFAGDEVADARGRDVFLLYAELGMRTVEWKMDGSTEFTLQAWKPWTHLFVPVPHNPLPEDGWDWFAKSPISVIMDVHFPLMDLSRAFIVGGDQDDVLKLIENKEVMLESLARADAVTVSQPDWAADLAHVNPNVFYLPDVNHEDGEESLVRFQLKLMEVATLAMNSKRAKPCQCRECRQAAPIPLD